METLKDTVTHKLPVTLDKKLGNTQWQPNFTKHVLKLDIGL